MTTTNFQAGCRKVEAALVTLPEDKIAALNKTAVTLSPDELFVYQEWKSRAQMSGILSYDDAVIIYRILCDWSHATLGERLATLTLMGALGTAFKGRA